MWPAGPPGWLGQLTWPCTRATSWPGRLPRGPPLAGPASLLAGLGAWAPRSVYEKALKKTIFNKKSRMRDVWIRYGKKHTTIHY